MRRRQLASFTGGPGGPRPRRLPALAAPVPKRAPLSMTITKSAALAVLTAAAAFFPPSMSAQTLVAAQVVPTETDPVRAGDPSDDRVRLALASLDVAVRRAALEETVAAVTASDASFDAASVVPTLVAMYASDTDPQCRIGAVVALHAIGHDPALDEVRALLPQQTDRRVQVVAINALVDHYGIEAFEGATDMAAVAEALLSSRQAK